jgi:hypothetical protein
MCVGYRYNKDSASLDIGVSFCNPNDRFSRKRARSIIDGRIKKNTKTTISGVEEAPKYSDVVNHVVKMTKEVIPDDPDVLAEMVADGGTDDNYPKVAGVKIPMWLPYSINNV